MAAPFFASVSELKQHLGGGVNRSIEMDSLAPVVEDTAERYLLPYLSRTFYDTLLSKYVAATLTSNETQVVNRLKRALALLTMYEYLPLASVQISEAGVYRVETETHKAAFRYQEASARAYFLEKGFEALETLLVYLADNRASHTSWRDSTEGAAYLATLLNRVSDFRVYYGSNLSRYTFECMKAAVRLVEYHAIKSQVPAAFWADFQADYFANTLDSAQKALLALWRDAIAHFSAEMAMRFGIVEYREGRLVETFVGVEQGAVSQKQPAMNDANVKNWLHFSLGQSRMGLWKQHIVANKSSFPLMFDTASGGTNTASDAWHINTDDEATEAAAAREEKLKNAAVVRF